jgi:hypothetical protein
MAKYVIWHIGRPGSARLSQRVQQVCHDDAIDEPENCVLSISKLFGLFLYSRLRGLLGQLVLPAETRQAHSQQWPFDLPNPILNQRGQLALRPSKWVSFGV